jgi:DNA-binding GntR family transcriptional regulator
VAGPTDLNSLDELPPLTAHSSLTDRVHGTLRQAIREQRLPPGSHLSVPRLAERLGVSRSPVRDAVFRLERDGLVSVLPQRGALVLAPGRTDLREFLEIREALEGMAARLAATRLRDAGRNRLRELYECHLEIVGAGDPLEHVRCDLEFHARLWRGSQNRRLIDALDQLQDQIELAIHVSARRPNRVGQALREHEGIVLAVEACDGDRAEQEARAHIRAVRRTLLEGADAN